MKHLLLLLTAIFALSTPALAQVDPDPTRHCDQNSGLAWTMNLEADMSHYNVYATDNPGEAVSGDATQVVSG